MADCMLLVFKRGENAETSFMAPYNFVVLQPSDGQIICVEEPYELFRFKGGKHRGIYVCMTKSELSKLTRTYGYHIGEFSLTLVYLDVLGVDWKFYNLGKQIPANTAVNKFDGELCPFFDEGENQDWVYSTNFGALRKVFSRKSMSS